MQQYLQCGRYRLPLKRQGGMPLIMGVLNVTPDSFSDGGRFQSLEMALAHVEQMIADGVDIIDIGGESSRPGAQPLPLDEELRRVMPVIYALRDSGKALSIDTCKPAVMHEAIVAGVDMVNDITGFRASGALTAVKDSDCALCIMHMQNDPQTMQVSPQYDDIVRDVTEFLKERVEDLTLSGIDRERLCIDPGFGFGKTLTHNLGLLKNIGKIQDSLDLPLLAGLSRKSMIGSITGKSVDRRLAGSIAASLAAAVHGAQIVRVHDVAETVDAFKIWQAAF
jgi:dihydropteroate synthase